MTQSDEPALVTLLQSIDMIETKRPNNSTWSSTKPTIPTIANACCYYPTSHQKSSTPLSLLPASTLLEAVSALRQYAKWYVNCSNSTHHHLCGSSHKSSIRSTDNSCLRLGIREVKTGQAVWICCFHVFAWLKITVYANLMSHNVFLLPYALLHTTMNAFRKYWYCKNGIGCCKTRGCSGRGVGAAGKRCSQVEEAAAGDLTGDSKNKAARKEHFNSGDYYCTFVFDFDCWYIKYFHV